MSEFSQVVLVFTAYRLLSLLIGLAFAFLGYKLFCRGVYDKAGDLKAAWGDRHLALKQATPGTFFAIFGVVVIAIGLWRGIEIDIERAKTAIPPAQQAPRHDLFGFLSRTPLDNETITVITKAIDGKTLADNERKMLSQWLEKERIHMRAHKEPPKLPGVQG